MIEIFEKPELGGIVIAFYEHTMAETYQLEQLSRQHTAIHRLHPLIKVWTALVFLLCVVSVKPYDAVRLIPFFFYPFLLQPLANIPSGLLRRRVLLALPFVLLAGISNLILDRGVVWLIGPVPITLGMFSFLVLLLKVYLTVSAILILVATTPLKELLDQLVRMKVPMVLVMTIMMIYRYLSLLFEEASHMYMAYMLRSPRAKGIDIRHMGSFAGQLLLRSIKRAQNVYDAMRCRGYHTVQRITKRQKLTAKDGLYGILVIGLCLLFRLYSVPALLGGIFF